MLKSTNELILEQRIKDLEHQLYLISSFGEQPNFISGFMEMDKLVDNPMLHIPLWGFQQAIEKHLELTVLTRTMDGFSIYYQADKRQIMGAYEEAKLMDFLLQKTQNSYIDYLRNKYK